MLGLCLGRVYGFPLSFAKATQQVICFTGHSPTTSRLTSMARTTPQHRHPHTKHMRWVVHSLFYGGAQSSACQDETVKRLWQPFLYDFLNWSLLSRRHLWLQLFPPQLLQSNQTLTGQPDRPRLQANLSSSRLPMAMQSPASQQRQISLHSSRTA